MIFRILLMTLMLVISIPAFADVTHGNGYTYIVTGKVSKLDADEAYIKKFTKAYGGKLKTYTDRKKAPKMKDSDGSPVAFLLRDPGKARGNRAARRSTSIAVYNQDIPQAIKDLAIAEFGATDEDFKAFPMGFRFKISERKGNKFTARFYLYKEDEKRKGRIETVALGDDTQLKMPKGVYKFKSKQVPKAKGVQYTLYGPGDAKKMATEIAKNLEDAGFKSELKSDEDISINEHTIRFKKDKVDGSIGLTQTTSKKPSVNLLMLVKSSGCKPAMAMGSASMLAPNMMSWKCE